MADNAVTIDDVARALNVSKTTVSRAVSGKGRISAETRARILAYIDACGYRPNAVAKGLAQNRTRNICAVIPRAAGEQDLWFFRECILGICSAASRRDYDVLVTVGEDEAQLTRILENGKADGFIAAIGRRGPGPAELIRAHGAKLVIIGPDSGAGTVCVDNANALAARELTELLIRRGAERLALLGGDSGNLVTQSRADGFSAACRGAGADALIFPDILDGAGAQAAVDAALSRDVQALVCMDDGICLLAVRALADRGAAVPERVKVACLYDSPLMGSLTPGVTAVRFDGVELGVQAAERAIDLIETGRAESCVLPDFRIILRGST